MHPSENAGTTLVPVPFDGSGYKLWIRGVLRALSVKNKVGFINGKCKRPDANDALFSQWERCNDMVTSWILNSLSKDLTDSLQYVNNAKELWQELEDRHDQTNGASYEMKRLWEELNTLSIHAQCSCQCICGFKANMQNVEQDRRLIQFLMGLKEVYTIVRGSVLMMNPLPSIAQAFSILIQEEK
ncbi:uncharacterized protein LOC107778617 [Nicotiana tabacum]|uniref:Uncharacterized protein LOC107778617 n=1 Tax=Nicotiana tabacum TaxID=4097 RepID=A0A1S3YQR4_TOBAC|nr:PREDICTED: uncharacterized protein LOC107778617 [Nicotiana tabacum]